MKVVVLAGGISTERDVSLTSGKGICESLTRQGYDVIALDPSPDLQTLTQQIIDAKADVTAAKQ